MKQYGTFVATEIGRKRVIKLYAMAKKGLLVIEHWFSSELFHLSKYFGYSTKKAEKREEQVLEILDALDNGNIKQAQKLIYDTTAQWYDEMTDKEREQVCRSRFVE